MDYITKKLYDIDGKETGSVLTVILEKAINETEKTTIENFLRDEAINKIYPYLRMLIYREFHADTASIVVLKNFDRV